MPDSPLPDKPRDDALVKAYNDVAYTSFPNTASHPDRLAAIATLLGLDAAPLATCRVLEMACGDGTNLVPLAAALPDATFVGFDFASKPVARAQRMVRDLGLANIQILQLDLRDLPEDLGTFDYIIAHGLYSWIPADVRARVLPLIARHLAPNGVAYVSYNTLPGCHMRRAVWEMLRYHTRAIPDLPAKVAAARAFIALVAEPVAGEHGSEQALRAEVRHAGEGIDSGLAHDDLSEPNDPVYFHEFMADAARAGLAFLAETQLNTMMGAGVAPSVRQALGKLDRLAREQYLDFVHLRRFRQTLLCRENALSRFVVQPARALGMQAIPSLDYRRAAAAGTAAPNPDPDTQAIKEYLLARWPLSVPVAELADEHVRSTSAAGAPQRPVEFMLAELYVAGLVDLRTCPGVAAAAPGEHPEAFAAARWISGEGDILPNLYHEAIRFSDPAVRKLLGQLDGTRTRDDLVAAIGGPLSAPDGRAKLEEVLTMLAKNAMLVA